MFFDIIVIAFVVGRCGISLAPAASANMRTRYPYLFRWLSTCALTRVGGVNRLSSISV